MPATLNTLNSAANTTAPLKVSGELGSLEAPIMDIIWQQHEPVEVGQVVMALAKHPNPTQRRVVAYTTVMTTMTRLARKGYLKQDTSRSPYLYTPAITRDQFRVSKVFATIQSLRQADPQGVAMALLGMMDAAIPAGEPQE